MFQYLKILGSSLIMLAVFASGAKAASILRLGRSSRPIELALLAALAVLSAGAAGAELLNSPTLCEAIQTGGTAQDARFCLPDDAQIFPVPEDFVVWDDSDPLFIISGEETAISLTINSGVTGNELDGTGFRLIGLQSNPPIIEPIEPGDIDYLGDWTSFPKSLPVVTNSDELGATIEWTNLSGANPVLEAAIVINLTFVPEPDATLVMLAALASIGVIGRSRQLRRPPLPQRQVADRLLSRQRSIQGARRPRPRWSRRPQLDPSEKQ